MAGIPGFVPLACLLASPHTTPLLLLFETGSHTTQFGLVLTHYGAQAGPKLGVILLSDGIIGVHHHTGLQLCPLNRYVQVNT